MGKKAISAPISAFEGSDASSAARRMFGQPESTERTSGERPHLSTSGNGVATKGQDRSARNSYGHTSHTTSALKTIMEQGKCFSLLIAIFILTNC